MKSKSKIFTYVFTVCFSLMASNVVYGSEKKSVFEEENERHAAFKQRFNFNTYFATPHSVLTLNIWNSLVTPKDGHYLRPSCFRSEEELWESIGHRLYLYVNNLAQLSEQSSSQKAPSESSKIIPGGGFKDHSKLGGFKSHFKFAKPLDIGKLDSFDVNKRTVIFVEFENIPLTEPFKNCQSLEDFDDLNSFTSYISHWFNEELENLVAPERARIVKERMQKMYS